MPYSTLFFDLDGTLYTNTNGIWVAIKERIGNYLTEKMGFSEEEQNSLREVYHKDYGTTLRGLQIHHQVNTEDYLAYVHDIPLEKFITRDTLLIELLNSLPQKKWVFTNADLFHAKRVMSLLGIEHCFDGIIDIHTLDFLCKPHITAYQRALEVADNPPAEHCMFFDDTFLNLIPAQSLGITSVLIGNEIISPEQTKTIKRISTLHSIKHNIPELWDT